MSNSVKKAKEQVCQVARAVAQRLAPEGLIHEDTIGVGKMKNIYSLTIQMPSCIAGQAVPRHDNEEDLQMGILFYKKSHLK